MREKPRFRDEVYALVSEIPHGHVLGYGHVAARLGHPRMARQVGWALAALEPGSLVPWWRVIRSNGTIALQGDPSRGLLQRVLLLEESVPFTAEDRVDMGLARWHGE